MSVKRSERWVSNVSADETLGKVARQTLRQRLAVVRQLLRLAATRSDEDPEYVHELRVATRRAAAAMDLYADLLPRHRAAKLKEQLKRVRHAAGAARDCDVLAESLKSEHSAATDRLRDEARTRRRAAQRPLRKAYRKARRDGRFAPKVRRLLRGARAKGDGKSDRFGDWARSRLRRFVRRFFAAAPAGAADATALHTFRVRAKKLRYAMEILAAAFPPDFADTLYPAVEAAQQKLGEISDAATARARIQSWLGTDKGSDSRKRVQALLDLETARLDRATEEFLRWWTPQRQAELKCRFAALLAFETTPTHPCPRGRRHVAVTARTRQSHHTDNSPYSCRPVPSARSFSS